MSGPPGVLVQEPRSLLAALERLILLNDSVTFWNADRTLRYGLRNDPCEEDGMVAFEFYVVLDEDDPQRDVFDMSDDGYFDDDGTYVLHHWTFNHADLGEGPAAKVATALNRAFLYRVCPCAKYLIKDDAALCVFCQMTASAADRAVAFCAICCEDGAHMHMRRMPCCHQMLHRRCLGTWRSCQTNPTCPMCRAQTE